MAKTTKKSARKAVKKSVRKPASKVAKKSAQRKAKRSPTKTGKKFLIIYHAPIDAMAQMTNSSPEEMAEGMAMWKAWAKRLGRKLSELGAPLVNGKRLHPNGSSGMSTRDVTGYSLIDADNWEDVMALLSDHPHISGWHPEATIEVHETMLMPGM